MCARANERTDGRFDDHEVHQLPVDELLERQCPERPERLTVDPEGECRQHQLQRVEADPVGKDGPWVRE